MSKEKKWIPGRSKASKKNGVKSTRRRGTNRTGTSKKTKAKQVQSQPATLPLTPDTGTDSEFDARCHLAERQAAKQAVSQKEVPTTPPPAPCPCNSELIPADSEFYARRNLAESQVKTIPQQAEPTPDLTELFRSRGIS